MFSFIIYYVNLNFYFYFFLLYNMDMKSYIIM